MGKVIVFGSLNMDLVMESERMPLKGETLPGTDFFTNPGGKGANQAVAAAKAGAATRLIGAVGPDVFGAQLLEALRGYGVDCQDVTIDEKDQTGIAVILRCEHDNRIILSAGANKTPDAKAPARAVAAAGQPKDVFVTQMECGVPATFAAIEAARERGMYTMLNVAPPKPVSASAWSCVDLVCVNETECEALVGIEPTDSTACRAALEALVALGPKTAIITLGERGCVCRTGERNLKVGAFKVDAVDTTGAGDTFIGYLAAARARGLELPFALRQASAAAALAASAKGAQQAIPVAKQVEAFLKEARCE